MANEFIARKGLISLDDSTISGSLTINTSGSTVFDIQGSQGQLFSVTDSLTGVLMSVNDISGLPILEVSSDDKVTMGTFGAEGLTVSGSNVNIGKASTNVHTVTGSLNVSGALNINGSTSLGTLSVTDFTASGNVKLGDAISDTHTLTGSLNISGSIVFANGTSTAININNNNLTNVGHITISDPGPSEGIEWLGGSGWKIFETPNDLVTNSGGNLQFVSGSTRVLTIGTDRTVNIPNGELNITSSGTNPTILLYDSTTNNDPYIRFVPATTTNAYAVGIDDSDSDKFKISYGTNAVLGTNDIFTIDTVGRIGINNSTPLTSVDIRTGSIGTGVFTGFQLSSTGIDVGGGTAILLRATPNIADADRFGARIRSVRRAEANGASDIAFDLEKTDASGLQERMRITGDGKVGIGTNSPSSILHIKNTSNPTLIYLQGRNTSGDDIGIRFTHTDGGSSAGYIGTKVSAGGGSGDLIFSTVNESSGEKMRISASGDIGIGTTLPNSKLDVNGGVALRPAITSIPSLTAGGSFIGSTSEGGSYPFNEFGNLILSSRTNGTGRDILFYTGTTLSNRMVINRDGNVGIGTTSPSIRLEVSGSIGAPNFTSGFTGGSWRLDYSPSSSSLEVDNLTVRGQMKVYELLINQIRATNGTLFVSSVGKVDTVTGTSPTFFLSFDTGSGGVLGHGFAVGDVIRAQRVNPGNPSSFVYRCDLTVTGISANGKFVTASLTGSTAPSGGMEFVRLGNVHAASSSRQGTVYLTADDVNAPYIDVLDGVNTHAAFNTASGSAILKTRMGKLNGITGTAFGNLTGYGFYASGSAFLEGGINATTGRIANWVISGNSITSSNIHLSSSNGGTIRMGATLPASHTSGTGIFLSGSGQMLVGNAAGNRIQFDGSNVTISSSTAVLKGQSVEISGSNFHLLNGNITASNVNLSGNITATTGNIGGFAITANALTGSGFYISGGAAANGFFISSSGFNVKGNGNITASAGLVGGFNITSTEINSGTTLILRGNNGQITGSSVLFTGGVIGGFTLSTNQLASNTGTLILKDNGQITGSSVLFTGGRIGGFTITNDVLSGTGFLLSGSATGNGFFISSSGFNVKASGNITASAGSVGGWNLSTTELSSGNVSLLATSVSGGLFVTSGSERILTVGNFADVTVSSSPGLFATASLFRSTTNGTATIASSSNSLTISRTTSTVATDFVVTTVTQSLGTIPAGRMLALAYTYADLTTYTSSAVDVTWNPTNPSQTQSFLLISGSPANTWPFSPYTSSIVTAGGLTGGKGILSFTASLVNSNTIVEGDPFIGVSILNIVPFRVYNSSSLGKVLIYESSFDASTNSTAVIRQSIPITYYGNNNTKIEFETDVDWIGSTTATYAITSSLNITGITSTVYVPAVFSASISSSAGTSLINSYQHTTNQPYSKQFAQSVAVPTTLTDAKLIFTVRQLGSGSAYTNLPSYKISDILVSADVPKVNITRNQALFYNSPLQYMQWTTSSFDIKGEIDATTLTVRGATNLLGPVTIEGDISAHPDINGANSTNNSVGTVIQNLTFDTFGHTTNITTTNLDSRYQPLGSYATLAGNQTFTGVNTFTPSSNPTIILGTGPSAFSGSISFKGTTIGGTEATTVIRQRVNAPSSIVIDLPVAGGTMAMLEDITTSQITGTLPVNKGGTGKTTFTNNRVLTGNGTSALVDEANLTFDGSTLTVTGALTTTGNAKLGDTTADAHTVTGSFDISGSFAVNGTTTSTTTTTSGTTTTNTLVVGTQASKATISYATNTARTLTIPNVGGNRTFSFIDEAETLTGAKTFGADITISKGTGIPSTIVSSGTASDLILRSNTGNVIISGSSTSNVSFIDGGTTNVFISSSGNVGIGTTSPTDKLQVVGQISGSSVRAAYSSSDGTAGLTATINFYDIDNQYHSIVIKNGLITEWNF